MVSMMAQEITHNEAYFPRAKEFIPERWLPGGDDNKSTHPFAYLPFGFGPRMCVGRRFADLEIETVMARVRSRKSVHCQKSLVDSFVT